MVTATRARILAITGLDIPAAIHVRQVCGANLVEVPNMACSSRVLAVPWVYSHAAAQDACLVFTFMIKPSTEDVLVNIILMQQQFEFAGLAVGEDRCKRVRQYPAGERALYEVYRAGS